MKNGQDYLSMRVKTVKLKATYMEVVINEGPLRTGGSLPQNS